MDFSPVAIKEANTHIQGLMKRIHELEEQVKELSGALKKQNEAHAENLKVLPLRMHQTLRQRDEEITELKEKLKSSEAEIKRLVQEASEKEQLFQYLKNRSRVLDEILKHRDAFESVLTCLSILEDSDYCTTPNVGKVSLNGAPRETDLLDSEDEDVNGNTNSPVKRADSGYEPGASTSSSSLDIGNGGANGGGVFKEVNPFGDVFLPQEEEPPPCFV